MHQQNLNRLLGAEAGIAQAGFQLRLGAGFQHSIGAEKHRFPAFQGDACLRNAEFIGCSNTKRLNRVSRSAFQDAFALGIGLDAAILPAV